MCRSSTLNLWIVTEILKINSWMLVVYKPLYIDSTLASFPFLSCCHRTTATKKRTRLTTNWTLLNVGCLQTATNQEDNHMAVGRKRWLREVFAIAGCVLWLIMVVRLPVNHRPALDEPVTYVQQIEIQDHRAPYLRWDIFHWILLTHFFPPFQHLLSERLRLSA